jgi:hypothetical protein
MTELENTLISGNKDMFGIYQLKRGDETWSYRFEPLERLKALGLSVSRENYDLVYTAPLRADETLAYIYETFNIYHPTDFIGHSLSVSDIVVLQRGGEVTAYYVDDIGFAIIPGFLKPSCKMKGENENESHKQ